MPVDILNTTTLSEALTDSTADFTVASTTNISVGNLLVVRNEAMKVQAIPVSGRVQVQRGWNGTKAFAHASGQRAFIGAPRCVQGHQGFRIRARGRLGNVP